MTNDNVTLELSNSEAIVLFEFLSRFTNDDALKITHPAERKALWNMCALLESKLGEPLSANYHDLLSKARTAVEAI